MDLPTYSRSGTPSKRSTCTSPARTDFVLKVNSTPLDPSLCYLPIVHTDSKPAKHFDLDDFYISVVVCLADVGELQVEVFCSCMMNVVLDVVKGRFRVCVSKLVFEEYDITRSDELAIASVPQAVNATINGIVANEDSLNGAWISFVRLRDIQILCICELPQFVDIGGLSVPVWAKR
jgi:hypothetical protein